MPRRPDLPCADCGTAMWRGTGSLPEERARCRPCRAIRRAERIMRQQAERERRRAQRRLRGTITERGYDVAHQRRRQTLLPLFIGTPCALCGKELRADQQLDLDHSIPLRVDPNSVADRVLHRACNAAWNRSGPPTGFDYSPRPCEICGQSFKPKITTQRTCSRACGVEIKRRRQVAA